jgi:quercetin dioxygenase-like cupin family protein
MMTAPFVLGGDTPWDAVAPGVRRQILGHGPDLMLVRVDFEKGATGALHHHPHRQVTWIARGAFDVTIGGETKRLGVGDCFFASADIEHGVSAIEEGTMIDVFTPAREDFLAAKR